MVQDVAGKVMGSDPSKPRKVVPRAMRAATCSHETFGSSNMPLRRLDEETVRVPPSAVSANSTWASAGQVLDSYGYQEDDEEASVIP